jgi:hypothetical protein
MVAMVAWTAIVVIGAVVVVVIFVIREGIPQNTGSGDAGNRHSGIHRLDWSAMHVIRCHAAGKACDPTNQCHQPQQTEI